MGRDPNNGGEGGGRWFWNGGGWYPFTDYDITANEFGFFTLAYNCCGIISKYAGKRQSISVWLPFTFA